MLGGDTGTLHPLRNLVAETKPMFYALRTMSPDHSTCLQPCDMVGGLAEPLNNRYQTSTSPLVLAHARPLGAVPHVPWGLPLGSRDFYSRPNHCSNFYSEDGTMRFSRCCIFFVLTASLHKGYSAGNRAFLPFLASTWPHHKPPLRGGRLR